MSWLSGEFSRLGDYEQGELCFYKFRSLLSGSSSNKYLYSDAKETLAMSQMPLSTDQTVAISVTSERPVRAGSDLPIFWLGEIVYATVAKGVENFYDTVQKVMRRWSTEFMVRRLLGFMVILNPRLNSDQQTHLTPILARAVDHLIWQRSLDPRVLRGIVALACPNQDTALLFGYLMEVVAGLAHSPCHQEELMENTTSDLESPSPSVVNSYVEDTRVAHTLTHFYCVEPIYVAAMSSTIRKAVLGALNGGLDVAANCPSGFLISSQQSPPICCITLEPLLCQDGTIASDVVAVIQTSHTISSKSHAFLYRGRALLDWLGHSQVPTNPDTRSLVRPTDIYRLS